MCSRHRPANGADSATGIVDVGQLAFPLPEPTPTGPLLSCDLCSAFRADLGVFVSGGIILRRCGACARRTRERELADSRA